MMTFSFTPAFDNLITSASGLAGGMFDGNVFCADEFSVDGCGENAVSDAAVEVAALADAAACASEFDGEWAAIKPAIASVEGTTSQKKLLEKPVFIISLC
jgi:hypothetical protein